VISDGARHESGALVGAVLDSLPARVAIIDGSGTIVAVNSTWREFAAADSFAVGATEGTNYLQVCQEAAGKGMRDAARFAEGIRSVLAGRRQEFTMEYPCHSPGNERWFDGRVALLLVGDTKQAVITHEDITGRKLAEADFLSSEARNKAMLEAVPDMMFRISRDGEYLDFHAKDEGELYVPPEEFVGRNLREIMPPQLAGPMLDGIARALDTGETQLIEYSLSTQEGVLDFEARLVASDPGEILSVVRDVTERKRAEEAVRRENSFVRLLQTVTIAANEATSFAQVAQACLDQICAYMRWPVGHVYLADEHGLASTTIWHFDEPEGFESFRRADEGTRFNLGEGLPGRVLAGRQPEWIPDVTRDAHFARAGAASEAGIEAAFAFPVLVGADVAAVLEFFSTQMAEPDETLLEVMGGIGTQLGRVIERERAEETLRLNEQRFRLLADNAWDVIFRYRLVPTLGYDYVSPSIETITGYAPEEFYADPSLAISLIHPEDRALVENLMQSPESPLLLRCRHREGRLVWIEQRNKPVRDDSGDLVAIEGIARDVTSRKSAERERERLLSRERAAHHHLEAILNNLGEGVLVIEPGRSVPFANPSAQAMLGMTDGATSADIPDYCEGFSLRDAVDRCVRTGETIEARARCGTRYLQIRVDRLVGLEVDEVLVVLQDLSEGHRLEVNQQRFLSNAAHQLRTPLTVILGAAELLASGGDEDPALRERLLNHIFSESRRMKRLSDVLLRLARVGWGEREPKIEPLNLRDAAGYVAELTEPLAESAGLGIAVEGGGAYVYADSEWLQEVLLVLISNSIQHSGRGGFIRLIVSGATVTVEDVGVGISPEDLPHIFERFYRGRGSSDGFGIGLSICKELTERMGGSISIRSQEGVGTTIKVELPEVSGNVPDTPG
jgi:PAS domain S-box-containing protein